MLQLGFSLQKKSKIPKSYNSRRTIKRVKEKTKSHKNPQTNKKNPTNQKIPNKNTPKNTKLPQDPPKPSLLKMLLKSI